ncbi:fad dependent oxidoreductase superfamily [Colletotrichum incanum]|uniref:Fad dependent oxidoreductase superfamily n=1 Tax=Colletotrichum incanum TaxID=1573173 RepID=A0A162PJ24_COLIC|nr:fad dependent oxidoreductase superfamily [Colletotrichum incanum]
MVSTKAMKVLPCLLWATVGYCSARGQTSNSILGPINIGMSTGQIDSISVSLVTFADEVIDISGISFFGNINDGLVDCTVESETGNAALIGPQEAYLFRALVFGGTLGDGVAPIIGSGISDTSLAHHLLSVNTNIKIVLIDAGSLCSGTTARNVGHIKAMTYATCEDRKNIFGFDEAIRITEFEESHLHAMTEVIRENALDCDLVYTQGVDAYFDEKVSTKAMTALNDMRLHAPKLADRY